MLRTSFSQMFALFSSLLDWLKPLSFFMWFVVDAQTLFFSLWRLKLAQKSSGPNHSFWGILASGQTNIICSKICSSCSISTISITASLPCFFFFSSIFFACISDWNKCPNRVINTCLIYFFLSSERCHCSRSIRTFTNFIPAKVSTENHCMCP